MAKRARAYKGEKRGKEIARQKKQEEKRLRRQGKQSATPAENEERGPENVETETEDKPA